MSDHKTKDTDDLEPKKVLRETLENFVRMQLKKWADEVNRSSTPNKP